MILKDSFIEKLKAFGINSYEAKIWTALLSRGISTAGELSDIANVPRSRSYDVLESLEKKGFVVMKVGKPIKYIAVPPKEVLERVKKNVHKEAEDHVKTLEELRESEVIDELSSLHNSGVELVEPSELSGSLKGRHNLYNHLDMALRDAEKSVDIMSTSKGFMRKIEGFKPLMQELKEKGVEIKIAAPMTEEARHAAKELEGIAEIRHTDAKARFIVVDGEEIIFMIMDCDNIHPTYDIGIWINTPFFSQAVENLFDIAWEHMEVIIPLK